MNRWFSLGLAASILFSTTMTTQAGELLLAAAGRSAYQIVLPEEFASDAIRDSVAQAGELMRRTFAAQGVELTCVPESKADAGKPAIHVGLTRFARQQGIAFAPGDGWTCAWKVVGKNLIVAGNDEADPIALERRRPREVKVGGSPTFGTLKSVCEFVYRFGGARFLSPAERDLVFLPTPAIFVPDNLDLRQRTWARNLEVARSSALFMTANGMEPMPRSLCNYGHYHHTVFDNKTDGVEHPEYYVFRAGARQTDGRHFCFSNPQVRQRIYDKLLQDADTGYTLIELGQNDGFIPCDCKECFELYGIRPTHKPDEGRAYMNDPAWGEKIWIMHRDMALQFQKDRPGVKLMLTAYSVTQQPPQTISSFPDNVVIEIMHPGEELLAAWRKLDVPGGYAAYLYTWGNFHLAGYTPLRSQSEIAQLADVLVSNDIRLIQVNGRPITYGIEGINIYALMRLLNDPHAKPVEALYEEYLEAAYQESAGAMRSFYRKLHQRLAFMPEAERYARDLNRNPLLLFSTLYTPELMNALESHLATAEQLAKGEGVKARLAATRLEFDFLQHIVKTVALYYRFQVQPTDQTHREVIDAVDARNRWLASLADDTGRVKNNSPSLANIAISVLKINGRHLNVEPFNWNIEQRRQTSIAAAGQVMQMKIVRARGPVALDSPAWKQAPPQPLSTSARNKGVALQKATTFQALYDDANLYIRVEAQLDAADMKFQPRGRDAELWLQQCVVLNFSPSGDKSQYYYLTYDPVPDSFTDAQHGFITDPLHPRFGWNDDTWNGQWTYTNALDAANNRWVSMAVVPFRTLGAATPTPGTLWMGNVGRVHQFDNKTKREYSVWADELNASNVPGDGSFGQWIFE